MIVLLDIWSLASANGGPTRSTKGLAFALRDAGCEVVLMSHVPGTVPPDEAARFRQAGVKFVEGHGKGYRVSLADSRRILDEVNPDIVHTQGIWQFSTYAMNVAAHERGIPVVISPHGMLDPWALSVKKWKKRLGLFLYQRRDLRRAAAFHACAEMEAEHIRAFGLSQPVILAPNGIDIPVGQPDLKSSNPANSNQTNPNTHTALFLSRLNPGKGLLLLAEAWAKVRPQGWKMVVVGPNERGHREEVEAKIGALGIADDWSFAGEVDDTRKWPLFGRADLFVHPSASENFGISIAEALGMGVPVITTRGCPWRDIEERRCGWWIGRSVENLAAALREAVSLSDGERAAMGARGRALIGEKYAWSAIGRRMREGYEGIV